MHLTLEADYAVRIVDKLAIKNKKMGAQSIAEQTNVPLRFALKILRKLVACGAVKSYKGAHGGYIIANFTKYGQLPCTDEEQLEASNTYK